MKTHQEAFNEVMNHLKQQGVYATMPAPNAPFSHKCVYRSDTGLKCAIGALIPDECYDPSLEGKSASQQEVMDALPVEYQQLGRRFLSDIQYFCHDRPSESKKEFNHEYYRSDKYFQEFLQEYNLEYQA